MKSRSTTAKTPTRRRGRRLAGNDTERAAIAARFKEAVTEIGGPAAFRREFPMAESTLHTWLSGASEPSREALIFLAVEHRFNPDWLLLGREPRRIDQSKRDEAQHAIERAVANLPGTRQTVVPYFDGVRFAAGAGSLIDADTIRPVLFDDVMLRRDLGLHSHQLGIVAVHGDSMEPTLLSGELVMLDMSRTGRELTTGIYGIRIDGALQVKRLNRAGNARVEILSDNPHYPTRAVALDKTADFKLIGRVVAVFRRL